MVGGILSYLVGYFIMISDRISDTYCIQNYNEISKNQEWGSSEISDAIHRVGDMTGCLKSTLAPARKILLLIIASGTQVTYVLSLNQKIKGQRVGSGWQGTALEPFVLLSTYYLPVDTIGLFFSVVWCGFTIRTPARKRDENRDEILVFDMRFNWPCCNDIVVTYISIGTFRSVLKVLTTALVSIGQTSISARVQDSMVVYW